MPDVLRRVVESTDAGAGGGSAAALAGAMAAGLAGMVARLSTGRGLALEDARYDRIAAEADGLAAALLAGADEDAAAYSLVAAAFRLRRDDAEAVAVRETAIRDALMAAALVPLENARSVVRVLELCLELDGRSNAAAASDLAAGRLLADAAVLGCVLNVEVNLEALPESAVAAELRAAVEAVRSSHARLCAPLKEKA